jgi:hypothetical protein
MKTKTQIQISISTRNRLQNFRLTTRESYDEVINRLLNASEYFKTEVKNEN